MAIPRASSGMLRSRLRPRPSGTAPLGARQTNPSRTTQVRTKATSKDDLGGPGGQAPPPKNPGGPEALKRNWVPIGGVALLAVAAYAYLGGGGTPTGQEIRQKERKLANKASELADKAPKM